MEGNNYLIKQNQNGVLYVDEYQNIRNYYSSFCFVFEIYQLINLFQ